MKSCSDHAGQAGKGDLLRFRWRALASQLASASMSAAFTVMSRPSSWRNRFSSRIFSDMGSLSMSPNPAAWASGRLK